MTWMGPNYDEAQPASGERPAPDAAGPPAAPPRSEASPSDYLQQARNCSAVVNRLLNDFKEPNETERGYLLLGAVGALIDIAESLRVLAAPSRRTYAEEERANDVPY